MKTRTTFGLIAAAAAMAGGMAAGRAQAADAASDEAQIRALEARFGAAVAARDVNAIMQAYDGGVFVFDLTPPRQYVGAAAYRKDWEGLVAGFAGPIQFQLSDLAVTVSGDVAYAHSIQHLAGTDPKGGKVDLTVRVSDVYRKSAGGWKIVLEHVSVPVDLATGKPDMTSAP